MFETDKYTKKAAESVRIAVETAEKLGHTFVGTEHLIYGILSEGTNTAAAILRKSGLSEEIISEFLRNSIGTGIPSDLSEEDMTPELSHILESARNISSSDGAALTGTDSILLSIADTPSCTGYSILSEYSTGTETIKNACSCNELTSMRSFTGLSERKCPNLYRYSQDLTRMAFDHKFSPVIGREKEINQVIRILLRKNKNNPCLVGEPGVGKTAVAEGLAMMIAEDKVPLLLRGKIICSLDLPSMLAGARYRGDFEERFKNCLEETAGEKNIILFIDEIHTIVGAGAAEGAIDAANLLKPELARGDIRIIGATTFKEYRRFIEKDGALERRFQPVKINEPDTEQLNTILCGIKKSYEKYHHVNIPDRILHLTVDLSEKYIHDRFLPDKVIDVIDEACSNACLRSSSSAGSASDILRHTIAEVTGQDMDYTETVTADDIAEVISSRTGIPASSISEDESVFLSELENELGRNIFGQDKAVRAVADSIRRNRTGLRDPSRPVGSFLFVGNTGTGKTQLAKAVARTVYGSEKNLIRLDMSEYMEKHTVSRITGAPPGYSGYADQTSVCDSIRKNPYTVVLFDEIEKAHPDILNLLLQITDEGELRDSQGIRIDMKNTLVIMTSNSGCIPEGTSRNIGFTDRSISENSGESVIKALEKTFRPELLGRLDDIIVFEPLSRESLVRIARSCLDELSERASESGLSLVFSDEIPDIIINECEKEKSGARSVRRMITSKIEAPVSRLILNKKSSNFNRIIIGSYKNEIAISTESDDNFLLKS